MLQVDLDGDGIISEEELVAAQLRTASARTSFVLGNDSANPLHRDADSVLKVIVKWDEFCEVRFLLSVCAAASEIGWAVAAAEPTCRCRREYAQSVAQ